MSRFAPARSRGAPEPEGASRARTPGAPVAADAGRTGLEPALLGMQTAAGNGAVARLVASASHHAGWSNAGAATIQREDDVPDEGGAQEVVGGGDAQELAGGAGGGSGSTTVGPPTNSTYSVSGSLLDAANTIASRPEAGSETSAPTLDTVTDGDVIKKATVTVTQSVELPTWTDRDKGTATQQAEWDRFSAAIATHEAGHVAKDVASWAGAHTKIAGKSTTAGNAAFDAISTAADQANATYDSTTKHGLTQGTNIDPNV